MAEITCPGEYLNGKPAVWVQAARFLTKGLHPFFFLNLSFIYVIYLHFTILYWFCHTSTWICHGYTRVPHPDPPSLLAPHLGRLSAPAPSILYPALNLDWRFISYMILCIFQCHSPNHLTLTLSHRVHKTVLYICVSFAVLHTVLSLLSF